MLKPQFIAMKMASVAPTTDSAPLMPHAHGIICGAFALSILSPVGIGSPSAMPSGASVAAAMAIRVARAKGIAHATRGVTTRMMTPPRTAMSISAMAPVRRRPLSGNRRLHAAPRPVPSRRENSVTVSE